MQTHQNNFNIYGLTDKKVSSSDMSKLFYYNFLITLSGVTL